MQRATDKDCAALAYSVSLMAVLLTGNGMVDKGEFCAYINAVNEGDSEAVLETPSTSQTVFIQRTLLVSGLITHCKILAAKFESFNEQRTSATVIRGYRIPLVQAG